MRVGPRPVSAIIFLGIGRLSSEGERDDTVSVEGDGDDTVSDEGEGDGTVSSKGNNILSAEGEGDDYNEVLLECRGRQEMGRGEGFEGA